MSVQTVLDWRPIFEREEVNKEEAEVVQVEGKKLYKTLIRVGVFGTLTLLTTLPLSIGDVSAATEVAVSIMEEGGTWDRLVNGMISLLDPLAKVFGVIAGIAIMTGNGKIGLERLFWLSIGYITARKVGVWIEFLNNL